MRPGRPPAQHVLASEAALALCRPRPCLHKTTRGQLTLLLILLSVSDQDFLQYDLPSSCHPSKNLGSQPRPASLASSQEFAAFSHSPVLRD